MNNIELLKTRARIVKTIREFFDERGFTEVETAVRIPAPAPEEHIDCPECGGEYLRASPELQMKKLLADGFERIYQIGPCFREGEKGSRHNPEFTMLEWYRIDATYMDIAEDLKGLLAAVWGGFSRDSRGGLGQTALPTDQRGGLGQTALPRMVTITVRDAYRRFAGWDPWTEWDQDRFDYDMAVKIEPAIKEMGGWVFLIDYPREAASLARVREGSLAERWEFYFDGMELANCFTELTDSREQLSRFARAKENRKALGEADYPLDYGFIDCLNRINAASGVALGVDRLVMILTNSKIIRDIRAEI